MDGTNSLVGRLPSNLTSVGVALAAGVAGVFGSYGAAGFTPSFVVAPVANTLSKVMPGFVVTLAITTVGSLGQKLNLLLAATLVALAFGAVAWAWTTVGRSYRVRFLPALGAAGSVWALTALVTGRPGPALGAGAGVGAVLVAADFSRPVGRFFGHYEPSGRRRVLAALVAALASVGIGFRLGDRSETSEPIATSAPAGDGMEGVETPEMDVANELETANQRSFEFGGMEPLVSERFYQVDISSVNPSVDASEWSLSVTGAVETELEFSYADLTDRAAEHRFVTLRCVGEALNGHKMDTALWSGIPVEPLLAEAGPASGCNCVMLRAADGFYEEFPLAALRPGLLAFGMNGEALPRKHGAPLRALVPGHWGEVNVKWLTEIELLERERKGYWEKRGWHGTGPVNTVAKLHARTKLDDGRLKVGGHAYAGTRGIREVHVSTDGGSSWSQATLTEPLPGDDVWRQWKYTYEPPEPVHEVVVRARDGTGTLQPRERDNAFPSGPTGWVTRKIDAREL